MPRGVEAGGTGADHGDAYGGVVGHGEGIACGARAGVELEEITHGDEGSIELEAIVHGDRGGVQLEESVRGKGGWLEVGGDGFREVMVGVGIWRGSRSFSIRPGGAGAPAASSQRI